MTEFLVALLAWDRQRRHARGVFGFDDFAGRVAAERDAWNRLAAAGKAVGWPGF